MEYEQSSPAQRAVFHEGARQLVALAWSYVVAVRVSRIEGNKEAGYNTGTGILLSLRGEYFVATAWHVLEEYELGRMAGHEVVVLIDNVLLEPPRFTFVDRDNDIVLVSVPEALAQEMDAVPYDPGERWPPRRVTSGDVVFFCGLPAYLRSDEGDGELVFGNMSLVLSVESASEHQFVLKLERQDWVDLGRVPLPGEDVFLGGLSGAPVFVMDDLSYPLVGLISEIGQSLPLMFVKSLAHIPAGWETKRLPRTAQSDTHRQ
jgi:hypothetical protein